MTPAGVYRPSHQAEIEALVVECQEPTRKPWLHRIRRPRP